MRILRFIALLIVAWCVMVMAHETGHILGGWLTGAVLKDYDLAPWRMPYSLHDPDPRPLVTLWFGPVFGIAAPVVLHLFARSIYTAFVADFCLISNGGYLALAWITGDRYLDTPRLLAAGSSKLGIAVFCSATILTGYYRFRRDCVAILGENHTETNAA